MSCYEMESNVADSGSFGDLQTDTEGVVCSLREITCHVQISPDNAASS